MSVRITGDTDLGDAMTPQQAAVDHLDGAAEFSGRLIAVTGDHQEAAHLRLAGEAREKFFKLAHIDEIAHRQMRHRLEAGGPEPHGRLDHLVDRSRRHRAEVDPRAGRRDLRQRGHIGFGRPRCFERKAAHEFGDRRDLVEAVAGLSCCGF